MNQEFIRLKRSNLNGFLYKFNVNFLLLKIMCYHARAIFKNVITALYKSTLEESVISLFI
jgi:hypothetical protein